MEGGEVEEETLNFFIASYLVELIFISPCKHYKYYRYCRILSYSTLILNHLPFGSLP